MAERTDPEDRFRAYLDDELGDEERAAFEAELEGSAALRDEFDSYRQMVDLLRRMPPADPPGRFVERVEGKIRRRSRGRFFAVESRLRFPYEAVVTVLLMAAMVALFLLATPNPEDPVLLPEEPPPAEVLPRETPATVP